MMRHEPQSWQQAISTEVHVVQVDIGLIVVHGFDERHM